MAYIDGWLAPVPAKNKELYLKQAAVFAGIFKENGALEIVECWGDDLPEGKVTSFTMAVQRKDDETVVFSWITWPSKEVRNAGMAKVMTDPRMQPGASPMPFDGKRLIFGGFEVMAKF